MFCGSEFHSCFALNSTVHWLQLVLLTRNVFLVTFKSVDASIIQLVRIVHNLHICRDAGRNWCTCGFTFPVHRWRRTMTEVRKTVSINAFDFLTSPPPETSFINIAHLEKRAKNNPCALLPVQNWMPYVDISCFLLLLIRFSGIEMKPRALMILIA